MINRSQTLSVVMFLISLAAAFVVAPRAQAGTAHQLWGEVGILDSSATYESNAATASLFLMDDGLAETVIVVLTPANATDIANFIDDPGSLWNWSAGNTSLAVIETVRGVNGWASTNWTTSSTLIMTDNGADEFPNNPLEAMPAVTATPGTNWVDLTWTGLMDVAGTVMDYEVFESAASVGTSTPQVAGGAVSFNHTGLSVGTHCYSIGVNYQRTLAGATWTGAARSESVCAVVAAGPVPPSILATSPADGAVAVALNADVVVTFSEAMNTGSVTQTLPGVTLNTPVWTGGNTVATYSHAAPFTENTVYTMTITGGMDTTGDALVAGVVPNPWDFTTVGVAPSIISTLPANGASNVPIASTITVTFSEAMNTTATTLTLTPNPGGSPSPAWTVGDTVLTWTPGAALSECTVYTLSVSGTDVPGNALPANSRTFTTFCSSPYITAVNPLDGALNVAVNSDIVVTFSEAMNIAGVCTFTPVPVFAFLTGWNATNEIATLSPTAVLTPGTGYNITVACNDTTGNALVPGPVPNPFEFVTATGNAAPIVTITAPAAGGSWTGGVSHTITWTVNDDGPAAETSVWLNYSDGTNTGTVGGPFPGTTLSTAWTAPCLNTTTMQITADAMDLPGAMGTSQSGLFTLDCTPPTVTVWTPSGVTNNLAVDVVVTFSEPMNQVAAEAAFSIAPVVTHGAAVWSGNVMTIAFAAANISPNLTYTVTIAVTATDASSPGLGLAAPKTFDFWVLPTPNAPTLADPTAGVDSVTLTWTAPTNYVTGPAIPGSVTLSYTVFRSTTASGTGVLVGTVTALTFTDSGLTADTPYYYYVIATADGQASARSTVKNITTQRVSPPVDNTLLIVAVIAIIAVVALLLLLMMRKKKKEEPAEGETPAPPPVEGETPPPTDEKPAEGGETPPAPEEPASPEELPTPDEKGSA